MREIPPKVAARLREIASRGDGLDWHRRLFDRYENGEQMCEAQLRMLRLMGYIKPRQEMEY